MPQSVIATPQLPGRVSPGQPMRASWGNAVVGTLEALTKGVRPPQQVRQRVARGGGSAIVVAFQAFGSSGDYLVCRDSTGASVNVALPWEFTRGVWHLRERPNSSNETIQYTYPGNLPTRRVARNLATGESGDEYLRPTLHADQPIVAMSVPGGCEWSKVGNVPLTLLCVRPLWWAFEDEG